MQRTKLIALSPVGLLQEHVCDNEFLTLCVAVLLNCTTRKQVDKIFPVFIKKYSDPRNVVNANVDEFVSLLKPLGFSNRRSKTLMKLAKAYIAGFTHASELPGVGQYGASSWEIFCRNIVPKEPPKDQALHRYVLWKNLQSEFSTRL